MGWDAQRTESFGLAGLPRLEKMIVLGTADQSDDGVAVLISQVATFQVMLKLLQRLINEFGVQGLQFSVPFCIRRA
jgi:hypothetical protein